MKTKFKAITSKLGLLSIVVVISVFTLESLPLGQSDIGLLTLQITFLTNYTITIIMLKNTLKSICFVGLFALAFTSCDDDSDDCQTCATVLIQDGMETSGAGVEVCGDAIDLLLATAGIDSTTMIETRIDCQ